MTSTDVEHPFSPPQSLGQRAAEDLRLIRRAIQGSGRFTAVPGWGGVYMAVVALSAGLASLEAPSEAHWMATWICAATLAFGGGAWSLWQKASRQGQSLTSGVGRKFLLGLCPSLLSGIVLTAILWSLGAVVWLPTVWLVLYGSAILSAGALSVPVVPITGGAFMVIGLLAALAPFSWGTPLLLLGFGGLHLISGLWIALRHGG